MIFPMSKLPVFVLPQLSVLWRANEHLDEVVVQGVVELALEAPFELRIVEIARMKIEIIGMNGDAFVFELDDDFHAFSLRARGEIQKRVLIKLKLSENAIETRGGIGHSVDSIGTEKL
jgi:hypothetical protein